MVGEFREIFNLYLWSNSQDFDTTIVKIQILVVKMVNLKFDCGC